MSLWVWSVLVAYWVISFLILSYMVNLSAFVEDNSFGLLVLAGLAFYKLCQLKRIYTGDSGKAQ